MSEMAIGPVTADIRRRSCVMPVSKSSASLKLSMAWLANAALSQPSSTYERWIRTGITALSAFSAYSTSKHVRSICTISGLNCYRLSSVAARLYIIIYYLLRNENKVQFFTVLQCAAGYRYETQHTSEVFFLNKQEKHFMTIWRDDKVSALTD